MEKIKMPMLGETMESGVINKWFKKQGERVKKGEPLCDIQTDKVNIEYESPYEGTLLRITAKEGEELPIQTVIAYIGEEGEKIPEEPVEESAAKPKEDSTVVEEDTDEKSSKEAFPDNQARVSREEGDRIFISPRAKKLALDKNIDYSVIEGTGPEGRIRERDVVRYMDKGDIMLQQTVKEPARPSVEPAEVVQASVETMSSMRKIIGRRMVESLSAAPHFYTTMEMDMTQIKELRAGINEVLKKDGIKVSFNDILIKICAYALREFPYVNSTVKQDKIALNDDINIGVAVSLDDGLIVPVIRNADKQSLAQIAQLSTELAKKARDKKLEPHEYQGGTFTISNLGMFGVDQFTAIINQPESAILAVGQIKEVFVPVDGNPVVRPVMKVTLSSDHRVIDGALAARFLNYIRNLTENPYLMI